MKILRNVTDFDPGSDTPQGAVGAGTLIAAGDLTGSHAAPRVSGIGGVTISGTPTAGEALIATSGTAASWAVNAPGGSAGGDLSGTYPNPTVAKINTSPLGTTTGASTNDVLTWNGSAWVHQAAQTVSPLTTKGDVYGFSSVNARIPIGADTYVLTADSTQTLGLKWAPAPGGGGGSTGFPTLVQSKEASTSATGMTLDAAPTTGNVLVLVTDATSGQITGVTETNVAWTQMLTMNTGTPSYYAIWIGKVSASGSATITWTKPGSFCSAALIEISGSAVTPTLGNNATLASTTPSPLSPVVARTKIAATTSGHLVVFGGGHDNTTHWQELCPSIPTVGLLAGIVEVAVGLAQGGTVSCNAIPDTGISGTPTAILIAEIT